jgi:hypothetical protein
VEQLRIPVPMLNNMVSKKNILQQCVYKYSGREKKGKTSKYEKTESVLLVVWAETGIKYTDSRLKKQP